MSQTVCQNKDTNRENCTCTYPGCPRKGLCCECIKYHKKNNEVPGCLFPEEGEKTHDRSIGQFIESWNNRGL